MAQHGTGLTAYVLGIHDELFILVERWHHIHDVAVLLIS